mmetsp:Transcript_3122/g.2096  ORF Transcript_3122/g.2096 Transcript_3122/m.2096 type:complete len:139 (+) Transcript_3122:65-481(+)
MESRGNNEHQTARPQVEDTNEIKVSNKKNSNFYVFLGKQYLDKWGEVHFHALGNAVSTAVIATENLVRNEYGVFKSVKTETITLPGEGDRQVKKAKLIVTLVKHANFKENMEKFNKTREENEKLKQQESEAKGETKGK